MKLFVLSNQILNEALFLFCFVLFFVCLFVFSCPILCNPKFSRQEYWSGLPFPSLGDLPKPGVEPEFPALQADSLPSEPPGKPLYH